MGLIVLDAGNLPVNKKWESDLKAVNANTIHKATSGFSNSDRIFKALMGGINDLICKWKKEKP